MPHAYTEDQLVEQPAIGLFAELGWAVAGPPANAGVVGEPRDAGLPGRETRGEVVLGGPLRAAQSALPNPHPPPFTHREEGGRQAGLGVQRLRSPETIAVAISGIGQVPPGGELAFFGKKPGQATGHGSGHETRQESGVICVTGLCSSVNTDEEPDIDADI